jgi:hypothetical protein
MRRHDAAGAVPQSVRTLPPADLHLNARVIRASRREKRCMRAHNNVIKFGPLSGSRSRAFMIAS